MLTAPARLSAVIACGGTGGHLFPGLAVAQALAARDWAVTLLVSPKAVDQRAVQAAAGLPRTNVITLPAAAFQSGSRVAFLAGLVRSYRLLAKAFRAQPPAAVLAMGGFTAVAPVLAGRRFGARVYLHESNAVPGRANRFLAPFAHEVFLGFAEAAPYLRCARKTVTGTPVRPEIAPRDPAECRTALGLDPAKPTILVMGGSQGASAINELVFAMLPELSKTVPDVQWIHLAGPKDAARAARIYAAASVKHVVTEFCEKMHLVLCAATLAISRAGASALAEFAAVRLPAILIPYPLAAGNHQLHNARVFERAGAAVVLEQTADGSGSSELPRMLAQHVAELVRNETVRAKMQAALAQLHKPSAASDIAAALATAVGAAERLEPEREVDGSVPVSRRLSVGGP
ncbi:MAG: undecaprenyldiphospho-muramoylpentapeptide beta-N-acetylglucosaminyltransferase [Verrucomicrobiales bacterium]|nr:undecaprenyldiphospho-muramoylpentapeptide beta-N-acetylglucosaminyltransferase [Verrucomicrobiales bacterium]